MKIRNFKSPHSTHECWKGWSWPSIRFELQRNRTFFGCYAEENINPRCLCGSAGMCFVSLFLLLFI